MGWSCRCTPARSEGTRRCRRSRRCRHRRKPSSRSCRRRHSPSCSQSYFRSLRRRSLLPTRCRSYSPSRRPIPPPPELPDPLPEPEPPPKPPELPIPPEPLPELPPPPELPPVGPVAPELLPEAEALPELALDLDGGASLTREAGDRLGVLQSLGHEKLQRDRLVELNVVRGDDDSHSPHPEDPLDTVLAREHLTRLDACTRLRRRDHGVTTSSLDKGTWGNVKRLSGVSERGSSYSAASLTPCRRVGVSSFVHAVGVL